MGKKNLLKIPREIEAKLRTISSRHIVAACARVYGVDQLSSGELAHLGIGFSSGSLEVPRSVVPPANRGKFSERNVNGYDIVRKDLGLRTHYNAVETPNWGDPWNGTHTVDLPYKAYPRDFVSPRLLPVIVQTSPYRGSNSQYLIAFRVDEVLDKQGEDFAIELLACLNLLQENVGFCGVEESAITLDDYARTLSVGWEILPPGTRDEVVRRIFHGRDPSPDQIADIESRYDFLMSLKPRSLIYGTSGLQRYFGALLAADLVVFENVRYGNAIYIMFENWEVLSQRSRTELLSGRLGGSFERIIHTSGWQERARAMLRKHEG